MSALKALVVGIAGIALLALVVLLVIALGSIIGGLVGALIAAGYNMLFGASFDLLTAALAGSIVTVLGTWSSAAANAGE